MNESRKDESRAALTAWCLMLGVVILCPFGEGGALPGVAFLLQSMLLAGVTLAFVLRALVRGVPEGGRRFAEGPMPLPPPPASEWFLVALAVFGLSALSASYGFSSLLAMTDGAAALAAFVLGGMLASSLRRRRQASALLVASALLQCLIAAWQAASHGTSTRPAGTFLNANHLASYLAVAIAVAWGLMFDRFKVRRALRESSERSPLLLGSDRQGHTEAGSSVFAQVVLAAALVILHLGLLATASRGALAGLAAGYSLLALLLPGRLFRDRAIARRARLALAGVMLLALIGLGGAVAVRFRGDDPYRWDRTLIWRASLRAALEHPLLGLGPGQFPARAAAYNPPHENRTVRYGKRLDQTHSDLLRLAAESGLAGTAASLFALGLLAAACGRALRRHGEDVLAPALASGLSILFVHALVDNLSERPALVLTGAVLAGSIAGLAGRGTRPVATGAAACPPGRPIGRLVAGACGIGAVYACVVVAPYLADVSWRGCLRTYSKGGDGGGQLRRAVRLNPFQSSYYALAAEKAAPSGGGPIDLRSFADSVLWLEKARALDPDNPAWALQEARVWRRGFLEVFHDKSSLTAALAAFDEAERLNPLSPFIPLERATFAATIGDQEAAAAAIERAINIEPNFLQGYLVWGNLAVERGDLERARESLAEAHRRREAASSYAPENPYENAVLAWNEDLALRLETALESANGKPQGIYPLVPHRSS